MLKIVRQAAKLLLPKTTVYRIKRQLEENRFQGYIQQKLALNYRNVEPGAIPPPSLIAQTAVFNEQDLEKQSNQDVYLETGYFEVLRIFKILNHFGVNLRTIGSVYELGCGTARLLRHFRCIAGVHLVGSDVNPEMIDWCRTNLPEIEFYYNKLTPPLDFAADNSFDLILASSVFTHIPIETQEAWLEEIQRILRPGGIFICSVLGQFHTSILLNQTEIASLAKNGNFTLTSDDATATYSTRVGGSAWDVFQTRAEIIRIFGSYFQLVDYIPGVQDFLVLCKPNPNLPFIPNTAPFPAQKFS